MKFIANPALTLGPALALSPITPRNYCVSSRGVFDDSKPQYPSSAALMEAAMADYAAVCETKSLALFFHGGLVSFDVGIGNAQQLVGPYSDPETAALPGGNAFPYFFVWESGLLETLAQNLPEIVSEIVFSRVHAIVSGSAGTKLGVGAPVAAMPSSALFGSTVGVTVPPVTSAVEATPAEIAQIEREVENDPLIRVAKVRIAHTIRPLTDAIAEARSTTPGRVQVSPVTLLSPDVVAGVAAEETMRASFATTEALPSLPYAGILAVRAGRVFMRVLHRFAIGRAHGLHNTVVEEILREFYIANIGTQIWTDMKTATAAAFGPDPATFVGTKMIQELIKLYDAGKRPRVTLLGHSAGTVYIGNFLAAMDTALQGKAYESDIAFDVIFMAPAVRADVFAPTLAAHAKRIRNFRWFSMHDALEQRDILVQRPVPPGTAIENAVLAQIYTSSLLYFIAGVLENDAGDALGDTPLVGMERYFTGQEPYRRGAFPPIDDVATFLGGGVNRRVFSDTNDVMPPPPVGMRCGSHHHGGFPSDPATLESVCYLLRKGSY